MPCSAVAVTDNDGRITAVRLKQPNNFDAITIQQLLPHLKSVKDVSARGQVECNSRGNFSREQWGIYHGMGSKVSVY
jgi:hypothetical protein